MDNSVLFDGKTVLEIAVNLVLIGIGWGKLHTQVREVVKWKEAKENDPVAVQMQTALEKQTMIFQAIDAHLKRLDEQLKTIQANPVDLAMSRFENEVQEDLRKTYIDRETWRIQIEAVKAASQQLEQRLSSNSEQLIVLLGHVLQKGFSHSQKEKLLER